MEIWLTHEQRQRAWQAQEYPICPFCEASSLEFEQSDGPSFEVWCCNKCHRSFCFFFGPVAAFYDDGTDDIEDDFF
jgi:hypothetical protein